ncbi:MAG: hypothetical protein QOH71_4155 [Blastocatellia bacterium]|jgi:hypothetical protein|nr:hypothetical protein [Blastocatellia bacterium]
MKLLHTLGLLLLIIASLNGCSKPQNSNNTGGNSSSSAQAVSITNAPNFSKVFEGTLNSQYPIKMNLQRNGENLVGTYVYTKYKVDIPIKGTIDGQDNLIINEFDSKGNQTGVFKGRLTSNSEMEGTWSKPNGDKSMSFSLKANGSSNEVASTNRSVDSSNSAPSSQPVVPQTQQNPSELNRQTALSLVRGRVEKVFETRMPDGSNYIYNRTPIYSQMVNDKVISCQWSGDRWNNCIQGPNSAFFRRVSGGYGGTLIITLKKTPTEVSGISRVDQTSAVVDVVLGFEDTPGLKTFSRYSGAFDAPRPDTRPEIQKVLLRLYDDGWRVERILN